jgi:DNA-binding NarL/FixJ family response regulator
MRPRRWADKNVMDRRERAGQTVSMGVVVEHAAGRADVAHSEATPEPVPLRVLIADDHPLVLIGVRRMLEANEGIEVAGEAQSGPEVLALTQRRSPDVVLLDLRMPGVQGGSLIARLRAEHPRVRVVVLSASDDADSIDQALAAGACAYVLKSTKPVDIASVLRQVGGGQTVFRPPAAAPGTPGTAGTAGGAQLDPAREAGLTEREATILSAVASGSTTKAISAELWVSEHTVKFHLTNIYRKLGVSNRSGAVRYAVEHGLFARDA